jgi:L-alanine-DL-glutamate epimerase-like enolase superfamily enzyme
MTSSITSIATTEAAAPRYPIGRVAVKAASSVLERWDPEDFWDALHVLLADEPGEIESAANDVISAAEIAYCDIAAKLEDLRNLINGTKG